jgi:hypothetical protein
MLSYLAVHDSEALQRRIDKRSPDLFKAFPHRPQLQVNCLSTLRLQELDDTPIYKQNQTIQNVEQIEALSKVRSETQFFWYPILVCSFTRLMSKCFACVEDQQHIASVHYPATTLLDNTGHFPGPFSGILGKIQCVSRVLELCVCIWAKA